METLTADEAILAGGLLGGVFETTAILALVYYVFLIIAGWKSVIFDWIQHGESC